MATLSDSQRATIVTLIRYLHANHDLPIDQNVVQQLVKIFGGTSGFACACGVRGRSLEECFRDEPIRTFLRIVLAMNDDAGGPLKPTTQNPLP